MDQPVPRSHRRNREIDAYTATALVASVVFTVYQFCNVGNQLYRGTPARTFLASLDVGVPWFFVLIGYSVFQPAVVAYLDQRPTAPTRTVLSRQAIAVIPAYYTVVTVVWFCRQQDLPGDWHDLVEHLTFTQVFDAKRIFYTDGPAWAVSVTVFFLLVLALVNTSISRFGDVATRRQRVLVLAVPTAALAALSLAWNAWSVAGAHRSTVGSSTTWYGPLANFDNFAAGMAVAVVLSARERTAPVPTRYRVALRTTAAVVLIAATLTRHADAWSAAYFTTICSVAFGCLIAAARLAADARPDRIEPGLAWFGRIATIAYGTYLWREPVLLALNGWHGVVRQSPDAFTQDTVAVLVVSGLVGWLSYLAIERPALQLHAVARTGRPQAGPPPTPVLSLSSGRARTTSSAGRLPPPADDVGPR